MNKYRTSGTHAVNQCEDDVIVFFNIPLLYRCELLWVGLDTIRMVKLVGVRYIET